MRIELVGGPRCGDIVAVKYVNAAIVVSLPGGGAPATYRRRDRSMDLTGGTHACYGTAGHRMYDFQHETAGSETSEG